MNFGGSDYVKVWSPWCERFIWFPTRIKYNDKVKWVWLRTVYYRECRWHGGLLDTIIETEYALNIFDILKKGD